MIPPVTAPVAFDKPSTPATVEASAQAAQRSRAEAARSSAGENAPANIRPETSEAISAAAQSAASARARDAAQELDGEVLNNVPAGPRPTFEESPLERSIRTALDVPAPVEPDAESAPAATSTIADDAKPDASGKADDAALTTRAQANIDDTRKFSEREPEPTVDLAV